MKKTTTYIPLLKAFIGLHENLKPNIETLLKFSAKFQSNENFFAEYYKE